MRVILFAPDIPQNTGNIIRTCAATGTHLTLVRPLGFSLSSRQMKRAGLDYAQHVEIEILDTFEPSGPCYFFSSKATKSYTEIAFEKEAQLVFGSETKGLPAHLHERHGEQFYRIPMREEARCLNLSNAVAIVLYEARRQLENF